MSTDADDRMDAILGQMSIDSTAYDSADMLDRILNPQEKPAPEPGPLDDIEKTGNFEVDSEVELSALEIGIKARKKAERDRFRQATDSEYWFAVCFNNRAEKDAFLTATGLMVHGDKYLDGRVVAAAIGLDLPEE